MIDLCNNKRAGNIHKGFLTLEKKNKLLSSEKILFILKMSLGSGIAWQISDWTGSKYPYLSTLSVILCLQATIHKSIRFSVSRIIGTVFGMVFTVLLSAELPLKGWSIAFILLICTAISLLFGANITAIHQIALSTVLILVFAPKLHGYGMYRVFDTIIGIIVAILIHAFILPPNFTSFANESFQTVKNLLIKKLEGLAVWIENGASSDNYFQAEMNGMVWNKLQDAFQNVNKAENSLRFNPFKRKSKRELELIKENLAILRKEYNIIEQFYENILQWNEQETISKKEAKYWAANFLHLADALKNWRSENQINYNKHSSIYHRILEMEANRFLQNIK